MIISDLNYLEDVFEATTIGGGLNYNIDSLITWANNLVEDVDKNLKLNNASVNQEKPALKVGKVEKKVENKASGSYAIAYSSVTYSTT